jgi:hypothetical protein
VLIVVQIPGHTITAEKQQAHLRKPFTARSMRWRSS